MEGGWTLGRDASPAFGLGEGPPDVDASTSSTASDSPKRVPGYGDAMNAYKHRGGRRTDIASHGPKKIAHFRV
jgi:hypothetical protein